jgi:TolB-like protein
MPRCGSSSSARAALQRELRAEPDGETKRLFSSIRLSGRDAQEDAQRADASESTVANRTSSHAGAHPAIAVMPFDNLGDASDEYFADGVVEEITSALSRIRHFFVIARQSTLTFKGRLGDVREVGRELGVTNLVEGTAWRGGDRLRISVQLVDAVTRTRLWSERYEGATTEIFEFQDRTAAQVAGALKPAIRHAEIEAARRKPPTSLRAYDLVMRISETVGAGPAAINEAIPVLEEALRLDPKYGRARRSRRGRPPPDHRAKFEHRQLPE